MKRFGLIAAIAVPMVLAGWALYNYYSETHGRGEQITAARRAAWANLAKEVKGLKSGFNGNVAIVIKDLRTGWEIDYNKDLEVPSASIVKIPIMLAYFTAANEGRLKLSEKLVLKASDRVDGSGTLKNAAPGSEHKIEELIYRAITQSDNTAANMLIDAMGFDELNRYFAKMGLAHTNLTRKMMDFRYRREGVENYTTAADMAMILERLYRGQFINKEISKKCLALLAAQKINDRIPKKLPPDTPVAHKTGLENGICHDVGIVYTPKGDFLICVLTKHYYKTARPMKRLIARLSLVTYNYYTYPYAE